VLAVRSGDGPAGVPINKSAAAAGVSALAVDPGFTLAVVGRNREVRLSRADLEALPQVSAELPIACVEGWSASGVWSGVRVRDLLALVGAPARSAVVVRSLQLRGAFRESRLPAEVAADPLTLLALDLAGEPLSPDHGYPCRIIAPNRPGVLQTKWVSRLEVEGMVHQ
jgi:DMSO/TMAO reductase YedYZ molybdopterin-dependent catalytic subunit